MSPAMVLRRALTISCLIVMGATAAGADTVNWAVNYSDYWDVPTNWSTNTVPQPGDDVIVDRGDTNITVTFRSGTAVVNRITCREGFLLTGGILEINGPSSFEAGWTQTGGTLRGTGTVDISGLLSWSQGIMSGSGVTNANGGIQLAAVSTVSLNDTRTLNNAWVANWTSPFNFSNGPGGVFNNLAGAVFNIETQADFIGGTLNNAGLLTKTAGAGDGVSRITGPFNNGGTVEVLSGTLRPDGGFVQSAGTTRLQGGNLHSIQTIRIDGGKLEGAGTVTANVRSSGNVSPGLSPGALSVTGDYTQAVGGDLTVELGGIQAGQFDRIDVSGAATLDGTLHVGLLDGFSPGTGDQFQVMTFASHVGDFAEVNGLVIGGGAGFRTVVGETDVVLAAVREICDDHEDNDGDGAVDCADGKCFDVPACAFTPTSTPTETAVDTATPTETATSLPTPTDTPTASVTVTATVTATVTVTVTATATPTATATRTLVPPCVGDCDGARIVTVDELIRGVRIALGELPVTECPYFDEDGSGIVEVNELITGVRYALEGCPALVEVDSAGAADQTPPDCLDPRLLTCTM